MKTVRLVARRLDRRTVLRGTGAFITLPLLEAMLDRRAAAAPRTLRWGIFYVPNGIHPKDWTVMPDATGAPQVPSFFGPQLKSLASDLLWINNLDNPRGSGGHEPVSGGFLTCTRLQIPNAISGKSCDQVVADQIGRDFPLSSLVVSAPGFQNAAACCRPWEASLNNISWRGAPVTKIQDPAVVFGKIVPQDRSAQGAADALRRRALQKSVLDHARTQAQRLEGTLGETDRGRLQAYLDSLRDVEKRLAVAAAAPAAPAGSCPKPPAPPAGTLNFDQHNQLMYEAVFLAFQCSLTPVATFMMDFEFSDRRPPMAGVTGGHHSVSHHAENPSLITQLRLIHNWYGERFAAFVNKMKTAKDVDGRTLLENSILMFSPGMGDGNSHVGRDIPIVLAGRAQGRLNTGRVYGTKRPLADLYRTLLKIMGATGAEAESFGDGTGPIPDVGG